MPNGVWTLEVRIDGQTVASTFRPYLPGMSSVWTQPPFSGWTQSPVSFEKAVARYRWDGEEAYNMIERSSLPELIEA